MEKIFTLKWERGQEYILEKTDIGYVAMIATEGGSFSGQLNGTVEPVGAGVVLSVNDDENSNIKVDMILKEDNGGYIFAEGKLILNLEPNLIQKMMDGETVDKSEYYYKGTMVFHTSEERLKYLEKKLFAIDVEIHKWDGVIMDIYML